jgi:hypothetical protein
MIPTQRPAAFAIAIAAILLTPSNRSVGGQPRPKLSRIMQRRSRERVTWESHSTARPGPSTQSPT